MGAGRRRVSWPPLRAVLFDLGDTLLVEEEPPESVEWYEAAMPLVPGAASTVRALSRLLSLAVVTNTTTSGEQEIRRALANVGLEEEFTAVVTSVDVRADKPARAIFQEALRRLSVAPSKALMVGNRLDTDVAGAQRAGLRAAHLSWNQRYPPPLRAPRPEWTITELSQLVPVVRQLAYRGVSRAPSEALAAVQRPPLRAGCVRSRPTRHLARVVPEGARRPLEAFVPDPGRLEELLYPGARVLLEPKPPSRVRKTALDLVLAATAQGWASTDPRVANTLVGQALRAGTLEPFAHYPHIRAEAPLGRHSRIDFRLDAPALPTCWVEVKSCSLVVGGCGRFPDAPSERATRHVEELLRAARKGDRAAIVFVVQREDVDRLGPNDATDPDFGRMLRRAARRGVEPYAFRCAVTPRWTVLAAPLPVDLT